MARGRPAKAIESGSREGLISRGGSEPKKGATKKRERRGKPERRQKQDREGAQQGAGRSPKETEGRPRRKGRAPDTTAARQEERPGRARMDHRKEDRADTPSEARQNRDRSSGVARGRGMVEKRRKRSGRADGEADGRGRQRSHAAMRVGRLRTSKACRSPSGRQLRSRSTT